MPCGDHIFVFQCFCLCQNLLHKSDGHNGQDLECTCVEFAEAVNQNIPDNLVPKLLPQIIKSIDIVEGDAGAGTIKQMNFAEGTHFKSVKHRIDEINAEDCIYNYTLVEGDALEGKLEKISYEAKFEASPEGGTIAKMTSKYYVLDGVEITEEEIKAGKEKAIGIYKAVEAYLLQNPDAYV